MLVVASGVSKPEGKEDLTEVRLGFLRTGDPWTKNYWRDKMLWRGSHFLATLLVEALIAFGNIWSSSRCFELKYIL